MHIAMLAAQDEIRSMPPLDQAVLALYYYGGNKLAGVGRELGITETRASQIHSRAVTRVSDMLRKLLGSSGS
jgi:RNA polymerase sigma factor for flagellar operon FliA